MVALASPATPLRPFGTAAEPLASSPMKLPCTSVALGKPKLMPILTPFPPLPEITFRAPDVTPPMVAPPVLNTMTPSPAFATAAVPEAFVPM